MGRQLEATVSATTPTSANNRNVHAELVQDAKRIFHKYMMGGASPYNVEVPAVILSQITTDLGRSADETTAIASIFVEAQDYILRQLECEYVDAFLESSFYYRYCVETLTGDDLHIGNILHNEAALFYFMEFVDQENQRPCLDFWLSALNFRRQLDDATYDERQAESDAMIIYEKYFSLQATQPLHLSDRVRFDVEERICTESGRVDDCFDRPLAIVERFFEQRYLRPFVKSPLFIRFLSELMQKVDSQRAATTSHPMAATDETDHRPRHRKTHSDCTGDKVRSSMRRSISSQNTLLAMDGARLRRPPPADSNMLIDSRQLQDPDMLWRRNTIAGLSFGRIDALGRYERNYETLPVHSGDFGGLPTTGSKLKQAVRKLVNLPEDRVQEEIAWQVAEMIIKDITNITLSDKARPESQL